MLNQYTQPTQVSLPISQFGLVCVVNTFRKACIFFLLLLLVLAGGCAGEDHGSGGDDEIIEQSYFDVKGKYIIMNGTFNQDTPHQMKQYLDKYPEITTLVLQKVLGSEDDEALFPMGKELRRREINTALLATSEIYSGGVDLFLSGVKRSRVSGAKLGVHSWSDGEKDAQDYPKDSAEHNLNKNYIADMLNKEDFYWFTIYAAPADGIHIMTNDEITKYGLINAASPDDLPDPVDISGYDLGE